MAVGTLHVEANSCPLAAINGIHVIYMLHVVSPSFPVSVVVSTVHLERGAKVVGGLMSGRRREWGGGRGAGERNGVFRGLGFQSFEKGDVAEFSTCH